jgi:hypothetical protein
MDILILPYVATQITVPRSKLSMLLFGSNVGAAMEPFGRAPRADSPLNLAGALPNSFSERSDPLLIP